MRYSTISILFVSVVLMISCSSARISSNRQPEWVTSRPLDNNYYIGIGIASKAGSNPDYIQVAKSNALQDMASEISVEISGTSILNQVEDQEGFREKFEANIQTKIADELEDYELIDQWESPDRYYVYYRLSKATYKRKKREKLERAKNSSKDFFEKAQEARADAQIHNALVYYIKAFDAIEPHLNEDLSIFTLDGKINLSNAIIQNIQETFSGLEIEPGEQEYTIQALAASKKPIKMQVSYKNQRVEDLPLHFYYPHFDNTIEDKGVTDTEGSAYTTIGSQAPKNKTSNLKAELDFKSYFEEPEKEFIYSMFAAGETLPAGNTRVTVTEVKAYLISEENMLGKKEITGPVAQALKDALSEQFFSFVNEKAAANAIVKIKASTKKGNIAEKHNLHTVYTSCSVEIIDASDNRSVFSYELSNIRGIQTGSYERAAQKALEQVKLKIENEMIPRIREINL